MDIEDTNQHTLDDFVAMVQKVQNGEDGAADELAGAVMDDLRAMAGRALRKEFGSAKSALTWQTTVLADETLMKMIRQRSEFDSRGHFFSIATRKMFEVLKDYQRERKALKRGGGVIRLSLGKDGAAEAVGEDLHKKQLASTLITPEDLQEAVSKLRRLDARIADVVEYRMLWGLTIEETANALQISEPTVSRDWKFAMAWLAVELTNES